MRTFSLRTAFHLQVLRPLIKRILHLILSLRFSKREKEQYDNIAVELISGALNVRNVPSLAEYLTDFYSAHDFNWEKEFWNRSLGYSVDPYWLFFARRGDCSDAFAEIAYDLGSTLHFDAELWAIWDEKRPGRTHFITIIPSGSGIYLFSGSSIFFLKDRKSAFGLFSDVALLGKDAYLSLQYRLLKY